MSLALGLWAGPSYEVTSRIHGIDGKIEIIKVAISSIGASDDIKGVVGGTLGDDHFKKYKKYRDAVIHARVLDASAAIALAPVGREGVDVFSCAMLERCFTSKS